MLISYNRVIREESQGGKIWIYFPKTVFFIYFLDSLIHFLCYSIQILSFYLHIWHTFGHDNIVWFITQCIFIRYTDSINNGRLVHLIILVELHDVKDRFTTTRKGGWLFIVMHFRILIY